MKKKLFVAGLIMIMALSMFSCGSSDSGESSGGSEGVNVDTFIVRSIGDPASFNPDGAADDNQPQRGQQANAGQADEPRVQ